MERTCERPGCEKTFNMDGHGHEFMVFVPERNTRVPVCSLKCEQVYKAELKKAMDELNAEAIEYGLLEVFDQALAKVSD